MGELYQAEGPGGLSRRARHLGARIPAGTGGAGRHTASASFAMRTREAVKAQEQPFDDGGLPPQQGKALGEPPTFESDAAAASKVAIPSTDAGLLAALDGW